MLKGDLNQRIIAKEASFKKVCTLNVSNPVFKEEIYKFVFLYVVRSHLPPIATPIYIYICISIKSNKFKNTAHSRKKERKEKEDLS